MEIAMSGGNQVRVFVTNVFNAALQKLRCDRIGSRHDLRYHRPFSGEKEWPNHVCTPNAH